MAIMITTKKTTNIFDTYLTTTDAAKLIGVTDSYVRRLARQNRISSRKLGPRAVFILAKDAEKMRDQISKKKNS